MNKTYETSMDWYLGRNPRTSLDDELEALDRIKEKFPTKNYRDLAEPSQEEINATNLFPTKEFDERIKAHRAKQKERLASYTSAAKTAAKIGVGATKLGIDYIVKPTLKLAGVGAKWAYNTAGQLYKDLIELQGLRAKYGNLTEEDLDASFSTLMDEINEIEDPYKRLNILHSLSKDDVLREMLVRYHKTASDSSATI